MTPPQSPKPATNILNLGLELLKPAPLLVQKDPPVTGKFEVDRHGNSTFTVQVDLSFLLGGAAGARAARGLAKAGAASHAAKAAEATVAKGAAGATGHPGKAEESFLESLVDSIARSLEEFFGPAPGWMQDLAGRLGI